MNYNYSKFSLNETAINNIILDIENYQRNIKQILNSMADIYKDLAKSTNYSGSQLYSSKASVVASNNRIINMNLESYKTDLNKVKTLYKNTATKAADEISRAARKKYVGTEYRSKQV